MMMMIMMAKEQHRTMSPAQICPVALEAANTWSLNKDCHTITFLQCFDHVIRVTRMASG